VAFRKSQMTPVAILVLLASGFAGIAFWSAPLAIVLVALLVLVYASQPTSLILETAKAPLLSSATAEDTPPSDNTPAPAYGECSADKPEIAVCRSVPVAANLHDNTVLADEPFPDPGLADRACEQQWFPSQQVATFKEQQAHDFKTHRALRRSTDWTDTAMWTAEDKERYENARRQLETEIAAKLRPDPYMIVERDPSRDYDNQISDQPFATIQSDHLVFHTARFRTKAMGTGDLVSTLTTKF